MKWLPQFLLIGCLLSSRANGSDNSFKSEKETIAKAIEQIPAAQARLYLYSLDPHDANRFEKKLPENSDKSFHWMPVLGKVEIVPFHEKTNLLETLATGVRESGQFGADCFDPRHGLRVVTKSATNDFIICFECLQVQAHGFTPATGFFTSRSPAATFNKVLDKYKIKKAK